MPSDLPIISAPDPFERRTTAEKYGSAYYLGIAGLVIVVALVVWFAASAYILRTVWSDIYVLHDDTRSNPERIQAAWRLAHDPKFLPKQAWDVSLRTTLPPLARYVLAESLDARIVRRDPRGYTLAAAYSEGWPPWLRLLAARPLLEAAAEGVPLPADAIHALQGDPDPILAAWATATEAMREDASPAEKEAALAQLKRTKASNPSLRPLIVALENVIRLSDENQLLERLEAIEGATIWLRENDPSAREVWKGWSVDGTELVEDAAPELP
jgi:hypothetical protein